MIQDDQCYHQHVFSPNNVFNFFIFILVNELPNQRRLSNQFLKNCLLSLTQYMLQQLNILSAKGLIIISYNICPCYSSQQSGARSANHQEKKFAFYYDFFRLLFLQHPLLALLLLVIDKSNLFCFSEHFIQVC
jgi:hypothetical protein